MDEALAAIAEPATGAAIARAVEPGTGEDRTPGPGRCLNCGTFLAGSHCHHCGQTAHIHRDISAFAHDFLHSVLHFDGKAWHTLPLLAWSPGELTRRYVDGERARFVSPLALFLFTVFLTFAVFNWLGSGVETDFDAQLPTQAENEFQTASAPVERDLAAARADLAATRASGAPTGQQEAALREMEQAARGLGLGTHFNGPMRDQRFVVTDLGSGVAFVDEAIAKANENPALTLYKLQTNSYKYSWLLIPLSAPFLWLLFPFSRCFGWYDHLVFVTYSISFMMILWVSLRLLGVAGVNEDLMLGIGILYSPIHIYRQLRGAYRCSRIGALVRAILLTIMASVTAIIFFLMLLAMGAMG